MPGHEHFEELCALAASGQISPDEWQRLREHLDGCSSCAETLGDFGKIGADLIVEFSGFVPDGLHAQMRSRFLDRARETGTQLSYYPPAAVRPRTWRRSSVVLTGLLAASVVLGVSGMYFRMRPELARPPLTERAPATAKSAQESSPGAV
jgi:anti-sigma factor RsiW